MDSLRISPYGRISDTDEEESKGVKRQLEDATKLIHLHRGIPTEPYQDNDVSAYQPNVIREGFERWLLDFQENRTDGISAFDLDRIVRKPSDLERIIAAYDQAEAKGRRTAFLTVQGSIDLSTSDGRTMARVLVAFASKASADTARRVARQKLERATNGNVSSNYPAFGWNDDGSLNEKAEYLREAISDVFDGVGPPSIVVRWQQQGLKTERGKEWTSHALTRILISPRIAGIAFYKKEVLTDEDGELIRGIWEPLVDEATWRLLVELLGPKGTKVRRTKAWLSGIARCGICGTGMVRYSREARGPGKFAYGCRGKDSGGCAGVSINGNRLDEQITELIFTYLENRQVEEDPKPFTGQARLTEIAAKKKELMTEYRAGLSGEIVFPSVRKLEAEENTLRSAAAKHTRRKITTTKEEWPTLPLEKRRAIAKSIFEAIVIAPSGRTGFYDPDRANVIWKTA